MADIAEQICLAVDQIVGERLKSINYDTTIVATIVSNKEAKDYKYLCSNGTAQFVAFSKDTTFKEGDSVQVTIPNNDYDQQKTIIGKYVIQDEKPYVFTQPFETFIDVSANLINKSVTKSLLANKNHDITNNEIFEKIIWSDYFVEAHRGFDRLGLKGQFKSWINALKAIKGDYGYRLEIVSSNGDLLKESQNLQIYNTLLLLYTDLLNDNNITQARCIDDLDDFSVEYFNELKDSLKLSQPEGTQTYKDVYLEAFKKTFEDEENGFVERKKLLWALINLKLKITNLYLSSEEMYGNPYNFQNYFEQEKVYDISNLGDIKQMTLYFYELSDSFKDEFDNNIPYKFKTGMLRPDNLFTQDAYVCLGYDLSQFNKEQAILYSTDSSHFLIKDDISSEENWKNIRLRWVHQFDDNSIGVVSEATTDIKPYHEVDNPTGYEIRWYQYNMGSPSADEYSGVYWERLPKASLIKNANNEDVEVIDGQSIDDEQSYVSATSDFNGVLRPRTNKESEQIKVIILFNGKVIVSNILTFGNQDPEGVSNAATAKTVAGLSLWCEDDSYGNYFIYGQNNKILESASLSENTLLTLQAKFADASLLAKEYDIDKVAPNLTEAKEIIWEFPLHDSMIKVEGFNYSYDNYTDDDYIEDENGDLQLNYTKLDAEAKNRYALDGYFIDAETTLKVREDSNTIYIIRKNKNNSLEINSKQRYMIKNFYNASSINNTVKCSIQKNNMLYSTAKEFSFGIRGTSGTDVTVVIDFDNNKTALTADLKNETIKLTAHLYDSSYKEVDFNNQEPKLTCKWSWFVYNENFTSSSYFVDGDLRTYALKYFEELKAEDNSDYDVIYEKIKNMTEDGASDEEKEFLVNLKPKLQKKYSQEYGNIQIQNPDTEGNVCHIGHTDILNLDTKGYLQILQVKISGWGNYDLIAYKAIPIRKDQRLRYIIGPVDIIYDSNGNIDYNKIEYQIYGCKNLSDIDIDSDTVQANIDPVSLTSIWKLHNPFNEREDLIGSFKHNIITDENGNESTIQLNNILRPAVLYTKDAYAYGVSCQAEFTTGEFTTAWIQPLVISQNRYPSSTLNEWDGDSILMEDGQIVAPAIAAGKKNDDNTFSGVMLGDWSDTDTEDSIAKQTGLYGFHHGEQSFAFKEDGTAFIGKSGHGRIYFDGSSGILKSARWDASEEGMFLDLDDGVLKMQKLTDFDVIFLTEETYKKGDYYIFKTGYEPVEYGEKYDSAKTYYKKVLTDIGFITQEEFEEKSKIGLYTRSNTKYSPVASNAIYNKDLIYYTKDYEKTKVTSDEFKNNYSLYFIKNDEKYDQQTAESVYNTETQYYKEVYSSITINNDQEFLNNKSKLYTKDLYTYTLIPALKDNPTNEEKNNYLKTHYNSNTVYAEYQYKPQSYPSKGPSNLGTEEEPGTWNTAQDEFLKDNHAFKDVAGQYYILKQGYDKSEESFDPYETYYTKNESSQKEKYITLSAIETTYPLSIGDQRNEASRNFKVEWDGTAHINNGKFKGTVTADYLECDSGYIGGWEITSASLSGGGIELNSREGSITGGQLISPDGGMALRGYLTVSDANNNDVKGSYFGYMQSNTGDEDFDLSTKGIGMRIEEGNLRSQVKATTYNAGLSYTNGADTKAKGGYISISEAGINGGGTNVTWIAQGIEKDKDGNPINGILTLGGAKLNCTVPKEQQWGIYARFA